MILYRSTPRVKLTKTFIDQSEPSYTIYRVNELIGFVVGVNTNYKTYKYREEKSTVATANEAFINYSNLKFLKSKSIMGYTFKNRTFKKGGY